jgi:uncharacterized protein YegP (UPF0339 family)
MRFKIQRAVNGEWYCEIQAEGNNETLFTSETYKDVADIHNAIFLLRTGIHTAEIVTSTLPPGED